jgi:hypothetical protein
MFSRGNLTASALRDFYTAFSTLAAAVAPVTVASLRASLETHGVEVRQYLFFGRKERVSRAKQTTMHRQVHALIALLLLVWFQVLWFTGSSLLGSLHKPTADEANLFEQSLISKGVIPREPRGGTSPSPSPTSTPLQPEIQQGALAEYVFWTFQRTASAQSEPRSVNAWSAKLRYSRTVSTKSVRAFWRS